MPIYEFYCEPCHARLSFFFRRVDTSATPTCPRCLHQRLQRQPSGFNAGVCSSPVEPEKNERRTQEIGAQLAALSDREHVASAKLAGALFEAGGSAPGEVMRTALARLEAGEDPHIIESELASDLDAESLNVHAQTATVFAHRNASPRRSSHKDRALLIDPELYEFEPGNNCLNKIE